MNQLTRQEVEGVIERLVDKTLSFGCVVSSKKEQRKHIYIGGDLYNNENYIGLVDGGICASMGTYTLQNFYDVLGHPITIGQVLEKMNIQGNSFRLKSQSNEVTQQPLDRFIFLWDRCGVAKSLQEIMSYSGWVEVECINSECPCGVFPLRNNHCPYKSRLKSPEANTLFSFLIEIGL